MFGNVRFKSGSMLSCDTQIWLSDKNLLTKTAGQQKPAANPFRNVAQSVRAAGLYPAWRGFESFRSDLPGLRILHPDVPGENKTFPKMVGNVNCKSEPQVRILVSFLFSDM